MKIKIKLWIGVKPKSDWQLRITCGGVLIERDQGSMDAMLNHCHYYDDLGTEHPFTTNIYGCSSLASAEHEYIREVLSKKERSMLKWADERGS